MKKKTPRWLAQLHMYQFFKTPPPITLAKIAMPTVEALDAKWASDSLQRGVGAGNQQAKCNSAREAFERLKKGWSGL